ncbi:Zn-ribbon domain-containing OB-fold protein [Williamsia muralis]|uniref:DNA-binding protein n=1 Tax=Williamsia marianensis TaxID=85044 RepID=A0A2G3PGS8_WILMA|nr:OB-fold domain-containing protein [Williamsia marianensis]PHV64896.1 DNA-binding protein [Williamsia marianensis]
MNPGDQLNDEAPLGFTGDDQPFWDGAKEGRLTFQQCDDCRFVRWPAAGVCPECLSREATWREFAGTGSVWSHVVYHRAYAARLKPDVPYRVVLVQLDCGVRLLSRILDVDTPVAVGDRLEVRYVDVGDAGQVPVFVPVTR